MKSIAAVESQPNPEEPALLDRTEKGARNSTAEEDRIEECAEGEGGSAGREEGVRGVGGFEAAEEVEGEQGRGKEIAHEEGQRQEQSEEQVAAADGEREEGVEEEGEKEEEDGEGREGMEGEGSEEIEKDAAIVQRKEETASVIGANSAAAASKGAEEEVQLSGGGETWTTEEVEAVEEIRKRLQVMGDFTTVMICSRFIHMSDSAVMIVVVCAHSAQQLGAMNLSLDASFDEQVLV